VTALGVAQIVASAFRGGMAARGARDLFRERKSGLLVEVSPGRSEQYEL